MPPKCRKCGGNQKQVDFTWVCPKCEKHLLPKETPTAVAHTPGPWRIRRCSGLVSFVEAPRKEDRPYGIEILQEDDYPTREGDLLLVAAAPELLHVCEYAKKHVIFGEDDTLQVLLNAAITKAKGETIA